MLLLLYPLGSHELLLHGKDAVLSGVELLEHGCLLFIKGLLELLEKQLVRGVGSLFGPLLIIMCLINLCDLVVVLVKSGPQLDHLLAYMFKSSFELLRHGVHLSLHLVRKDASQSDMVDKLVFMCLRRWLLWYLLAGLLWLIVDGL